MRDTPRPICKHICRTFVKEPPPSNVDIHIIKLPAQAFLHPGIRGWVCHVKIFCVHFGLLHVTVTTPSEPTAFVSTSGLLALH